VRLGFRGAFGAGLRSGFGEGLGVVDGFFLDDCDGIVCCWLVCVLLMKWMEEMYLAV
jgi:hypothetical protein